MGFLDRVWCKGEKTTHIRVITIEKNQTNKGNII